MFRDGAAKRIILTSAAGFFALFGILLRLTT